MRSFGVKNVDLGGINSPSRAVRSISATLTGRLCRPLSSLFLVQWEEQRRLYPGARVIGGLF